MAGILKIENLKKTYKNKKTVLDHLDLIVDPGQSVAIMGRSGAGKTTLLNILGGLDTDYDGVVEFMGKSLKNMKERDLAGLRNQQIGFVFQAFHLVPAFTVLENVTLPAFFGGLDPEQARSRAIELLTALGLEKKLHDLPSELSAGERQRAAIARAMLNDPAMLLCDEPTGNLDPETGEQVLSIFQELAKRGKTLIVVTHSPDVAKRFDRLMRMENGRLREVE